MTRLNAIKRQKAENQVEYNKIYLFRFTKNVLGGLFVNLQNDDFQNTNNNNKKNCNYNNQYN